jgi:hypothetical protein
MIIISKRKMVKAIDVRIAAKMTSNAGYAEVKLYRAQLYQMGSLKGDRAKASSYHP